jgi:hypothetical protein
MEFSNHNIPKWKSPHFPPWTHACLLWPCVPIMGCTSPSGRNLDRTPARPQGRVGHQSARPSWGNNNHHGGSRWGFIRTSTKTFAPLIMGPALYKVHIPLRPLTFTMIPSLQLLPQLQTEILGGSLGATPTFCPFFH